MLYKVDFSEKFHNVKFLKLSELVGFRCAIYVNFEFLGGNLGMD